MICIVIPDHIYNWITVMLCGVRIQCVHYNWTIISVDRFILGNFSLRCTRLLCHLGINTPQRLLPIPGLTSMAQDVTLPVPGLTSMAHINLTFTSSAPQSDQCPFKFHAL